MRYKQLLCSWECDASADKFVRCAIALPRGYSLVAKGVDVFVRSPKQQWSQIVWLRLSAYVDGFRAALYV